MRFIRRFFLNRKWWLALLFILLVAGCGRQESVQTGGKYGGKIAVRLLDNPTDLDPRSSRDAASYRVIELVYSSLFRFDSTGRTVPELVDTFFVKNDVEYTFVLKPGVYFHDGKPLTAEDAVFTLQWLKDHPGKAITDLYARLIRSITLQDERTFVIRLKEIYAPFIGLLTVGIVPRHIAEISPDTLHHYPIGSGPFRFERWLQDQEIALSAFQQYFEGRPYLDRVRLKIIADENTAMLAMNSGELDVMMNNFNLANLKIFQDNPTLNVQYGKGSNFTYLAFNLQNRYLKKAAVRQAIAYAIDVESIITTLHGGIYPRATSLLPTFHWAYDSSLVPIPYDPARAKELLDQAGYRDPDGDGPRMRFTLVYKCTDKQSSRQKAQIFQSYLEKVGIGLKIEANEWGTFFQDIRNGMFDVYSLTQVGIYDPDIFYHFFFSMGPGNRFSYRNREMDRLIILSNSTLDGFMRKKYVQQIQQILMHDLPILPLWHETNIAILNKRVQNFAIYPAAEFRSLKNVFLREDL